MSSAQTMKIFSIINRIKQELEESPRSKFGGTNKRVVEVDRLLDLLEDLKVVIPEDIRRATGIISEAENTIADAKESAGGRIQKPGGDWSVSRHEWIWETLSVFVW